MTSADRPGESFAASLVDPSVSAGREFVFYEQEETRGVRTNQFAYWERIEGVGEAELYDMKADPDQTVNLINDPGQKATIEALQRRLADFFDRYSDPQYDLWKGGVAKGSVVPTRNVPSTLRRVMGARDKNTPAIHGASFPDRMNEASLARYRRTKFPASFVALLP